MYLMSFEYLKLKRSMKVHMYVKDMKLLVKRRGMELEVFF